ncbi:MAG: hypothetical protein HQ472_08510 [Ignavibacteria bacterium]|nr:hypothetical protein [Ignavibacteria bacterium]
MKKQLITLAVMILGAVCAVAQPNLNLGSLPAAGTSYTQLYADTANVRIGLPGIGVTWNFSQLKQRIEAPNETIVRYLSPLNTTSQFRILFPTNEVAVVEDTVQGAYGSVGGFWRNLGATTTATDMVVSASDPYDTRPIEVVFNDKHTDDFKATINVRATSVKLSRGGSATFVYDGYGTLTLPAKEITEVARITTVLITSDTLIIGPATFVLTSTDTTTTWQRTNSARILLKISTAATRTTRNGQPFGTPMYKKTVSYSKGENSTSVFESTADMLMWPHPVTSEQLCLRGIQGEIETMELVSIQGVGLGQVEFQRLDESTVQCSIPPTANGMHTLLVRKKCSGNNCGTLAFPMLIIR